MEDFFGNPIDDRDRRPTDPVPCPICGEPCATRDALAAHARFLHGLDDRALFGRAASDRPARLRRWFDSLGFLPLWFVLPLNVGLVVLVWMSVRDPFFDFTSGLLVRLALLPAILLLVARVASTKPRL
ncbi:MAG: hypothetical protein KDB33_18285 [Acidimicrobiales bacterium]|nr:hypothetical protein [Acidimicrobiales bacterium]MCB1262313.1 hypothetical protein [Acidimicrobiales bacterium]